jgi:glyoxylase-like metal-dependent hydrolase (beta-lactamase superfamily II)
MIAMPLRALRLILAALVGSLWFGAGVAASPFPTPQQVAPGVYVMPGEPAEANRENQGNVANTGFIVGEDGVIVVDTGTSDAYGKYLLAAIEKITAKPVLLAINTHAAPAHIFGNGAFVRRQVPILAHRDTDSTIRRRCETCLNKLQTTLGADLMQGTALVPPTQLIDASQRLRVAGRVLDILYFGDTHSPGAIAVLDRSSGVLFAGALASIDRIPEVRDANVERWIAALALLQTVGATRIVPAHGPVSKPERLRETASYLAMLSVQVKRSFQDGVGLGEAARHCAVPAFAGWALYDVLHPQNVHYHYLATERAYLKAP